MTTQPRIVTILCYKCGKSFRPYGSRIMDVPAYVKAICPYCKTENKAFFDEELKREVARRELNLDNQLGIKELESKYNLLKAEVESLNKRIEGMNKEIQSIKEAIGSLIPAIRKQVAEAITNMLQPPKSKENPLST